MKETYRRTPDTRNTDFGHNPRLLDLTLNIFPALQTAIPQTPDVKTLDGVFDGISFLVPICREVLREMI